MLLMFRMLRRYRKIKGDSRPTATGDRGQHHFTSSLLPSGAGSRLCLFLRLRG